MRFASRTVRFAGEGSDAWEIHDRALERLRQGEDILLLSIGDPDFDTPLLIRDAALRALATSRTHYSPSVGEPALRSAIAADASARVGWAVDPERIIVLPGAQAALYAVAQCLLEEGDELVTAEPAYVTYEAVVASTGATMRMVPLRPEHGFHPDAQELEAAVTPRTRALLLNFPHNPTGAILTGREAEAIASICRRQDLTLISDEVYTSLTFAEGHCSPARLPGMAERTVLIGSVSKSFAMTGWRCGWAIAPPELAVHLERLVRCMFFGVSQFVQDAAAAALTRGDTEVERLRSEYLRRAGIVVDGLRGAPGVIARMPESGMYVFADIRQTGLDGKAFASRLLDDTGVAVTPGEGFGPSGAGHVRITLGTSGERLRLACERISRFAASLAERPEPRAGQLLA